MPYSNAPDTQPVNATSNTPIAELNPGELPLLVTPAEAGRLLSVDRVTIYRLLIAGDIRAISIGRARRVVVASLHDYIARKLELG
jgi:excisionase family DNA binding protein